MKKKRDMKHYSVFTVIMKKRENAVIQVKELSKAVEYIKCLVPEQSKFTRRYKYVKQNLSVSAEYWRGAGVTGTSGLFTFLFL